MAHLGQTLTVGERRILRMTAEGLVSKQVAVNLGLSREMVNHYRRTTMQKLGASNVAHAIAIAFRRGILT